MKKDLAYFTAGQLAKIHNLNKRTLHYYDEVEIFLPKYKSENGYRYYSFEQSMELENILALRELGMTIEEIKKYIQNPNGEDFCNLATEKINEIDLNIKKLKSIKKLLTLKKQNLIYCNNIYHGKIEMVEIEEQNLLLTPLKTNFDTTEGLLSNSKDILLHLNNAWDISSYREGCGSYIDIEKIKAGDFEFYDGIFSNIDLKHKHLYKKPKGKYIRGFCIGDWDQIPEIYKKIIDFADINNLSLSGYAFESGLNEIAISNEDEYVTQIEIKCD